MGAERVKAEALQILGLFPVVPPPPPPRRLRPRLYPLALLLVRPLSPLSLLLPTQLGW
jgi:hypothetical protein